MRRSSRYQLSLIHTTPQCRHQLKNLDFILSPPDDLFDIALEDDLLLVPPSSISPYWEVLDIADAPAVEAAVVDRYKVDQSTALAWGPKFDVAGPSASEASVPDMEAKLADGAKLELLFLATGVDILSYSIVPERQPVHLRISAWKPPLSTVNISTDFFADAIGAVAYTS